VLVTTLVALLAVLMTGLAALPLLRDAELRDQRRQLSQLADAAAASTQTSGPLTDEIQQRLINTLRQEQVSLALISPGGTTPDGMSALSVAPVWTTGKVSSTYSVDGQSYMLEGRLIAQDTALLLIQPTSVSGFGLRELWGRIGMAIVIGGVLAAIAGALLARRVTKPLRTLVNAARQVAGR
jgi:two-component system OmpR family sensor kinase